jgi:hypothetical protein
MRRGLLPALLAAVLACAGAPGESGAQDAGRLERAARSLADHGFESIRVEALGAASDSSGGCRVRLENRRFRSPGFALGVIGAVLAPEFPGRCEVVLLRQDLPVARVSFTGSAFLAFARGTGTPADFAGRLELEVLPDLPRAAGPAASSARLRIDLAPRVLFDSRFGHLQEPFAYHLEIAPELTTQPWAGALLRAGWTFPIRHTHDLEPTALHPDYDRSRPGELALYQFLRVGRRTVGSVSGGYLGQNRYGVSVGAGTAAGNRLYLDLSADLTGALAFYPEITYSGLTRLTFAGAATFHPSSPDLAFTLRGGRYLFATQAGSGTGEFSARAEVARRFHQVEVGLFVVRSQSNRFGGLRITLPLPPQVRFRPAAVRVGLLPAFPFEYRTEEDQFEAQPLDPRLRSALLEDLWPASIRGQLDLWREGYRFVQQGVAPPPR